MFVKSATELSNIFVKPERVKIGIKSYSDSKESAMPPPFAFVADHPFLFVIRENETGTSLFIGRYTDP
jgi:serpin B